MNSRTLGSLRKCCDFLFKSSKAGIYADLLVVESSHSNYIPSRTASIVGEYLDDVSTRSGHDRFQQSNWKHRTLLTVNLSAGDLAVVGYNSDTNDFAVVALTDIPASSVIHFTDRGWEGVSLRPQSGLETMTTWTTPGSVISAGSIIRISRDEPAFIGTSFGSLVGAGSLDTSSGDQVLAYQTGDDNPSSAPNLITAFNGNDPAAFGGTDANNDGWEDGTFQVGNQWSELPLGLTANFTAYGIAGQIAGGEVDKLCVQRPHHGC